MTSLGGRRSLKEAANQRTRYEQSSGMWRSVGTVGGSLWLRDKAVRIHFLETGPDGDGVAI